MQKKTNVWQLIGFAVVSLGGTVLHFLYEWFGESLLIAPFSGVNESTWEHMKLLFFPLVFFALAENYFIKNKNFWFVKFIGTLTGLIAIPTIFYTLNGAFGKTPDWLNITIFFIATAIVFFTETVIFHHLRSDLKVEIFSIVALLIIAVAFVVFTFLPPELPLFLDPVENYYGIK